MFAGKRVRVALSGNRHTLIFMPLPAACQSPDRGFDTCYVTVIEYGNAVGETMNQTNLPRSQCGSRRGNYVFYARLVHRDNVRVSLDQETSVLLDNSLFGKNRFRIARYSCGRFLIRELTYFTFTPLVAVLNTRPPNATTFPRAYEQGKSHVPRSGHEDDGRPSRSRCLFLQGTLCSLCAMLLRHGIVASVQ